jgi:hypothetical protein
LISGSRPERKAKPKEDKTSSQTIKGLMVKKGGSKKEKRSLFPIALSRKRKKTESKDR